jgi:hypothetical protein
MADFPKRPEHTVADKAISRPGNSHDRQRTTQRQRPAHIIRRRRSLQYERRHARPFFIGTDRSAAKCTFKITGRAERQMYSAFVFSRAETGMLILYAAALLYLFDVVCSIYHHK